MFPALLAVFSVVAPAFAAQIPFVEPQPTSPTPSLDNSSAPFIFNGLSGLLSQWPNTYHGNGHTIIPGILEPFTLLYHARKDNQIPPTCEWFAFDPEMSYGIMGGRGQTHLLTYRTLRRAKIVYFDGMSAGLNSGWLDSQEILISGSGQGDSEPERDYPVHDEQRRLEELCKWGEQYDIDGYVRMNAGFEIMWCDFHSPAIQLVSNLNITAPGTPANEDSDSRGGPPRGPGRILDFDLDEPSDALLSRLAPGRGPNRGGGGGHPPFSGGGTIFSATSFPEWLRSATRHQLKPQTHVQLDYASFVTFYHPRLESLKSGRAGQPMRLHRPWVNISDEDAELIIRETAEVVQRPLFASGSGMNWDALAQDVVEYWSGRILELHDYLTNASATLEANSTANATETLVAVQRMTYSPLNPFMDTTNALVNVTARDLFFGTHGSSPDSALSPYSHLFSSYTNMSALQRCVYSFTGGLHDSHVPMTPQEQILQMSVETVQERLCSDYGTVFVESMDVHGTPTRQDVLTMLDNWSKRMTSLIQWLDWTSFLRCDEICSGGTVCTMPLWPVNMFMGGGPRGGGGPSRRPGGGGGSDTDENGVPYWKPRCMSVRPSTQQPFGRRFGE